MLQHVAAAFALVAPLSSCLASPATAAPTPVNHARQQHATENTLGGGGGGGGGGGSDPSLLEQQRLDRHELRRTIEESVLQGLAAGMLAHREKVERGELRRRPFVTLTYAQSIDGSIAGADKSQASRRSLGAWTLFAALFFKSTPAPPHGTMSATAGV